MFSAVCDNCGNDCQVPFRPSGEKPVYCSNCFDKTSDRGGRNESRNDYRPQRSFRDQGSRFDRPRNDRPSFDATCDNCGKQCSVPFKPTQDKPIFCDECFKDNKDAGRGHASNALEARLENLETKVDQLISLLSPQAPKTKKVITKRAEKLEEEVVSAPAITLEPEAESDELTADDLLDMETLSEVPSKPTKAKKVAK
jgi:CxxC-x17-CxxC domain-containing protein